MADGSRHQLGIIKEVVAGTTPATPAFQKLRHTGCTLALKKESLTTNELRADRQIPFLRHGNRSCSGDINVEMSYGTYDTLLEGLFCGTWTTNVLKAGIDRHTYTIERYFADLQSAQKPYHRFTGCEVVGASLEVAPNAMATLGFNMFARNASVNTGIVSGATYVNESTTAQMDSFTGAITEGGSAIAVVTKLSLKIDNGVKPRYVIGSAASISPERGSTVVTGSLTAYFEDSALLEKFLNETASSLTFTLSAGASSYLFNLPSLVYTGGDLPVSGPGAITLTMPFQAVYNSGQATSAMVTRTP